MTSLIYVETQSVLSINRQLFTVQFHFELVLTGISFIMNLECLFVAPGRLCVFSAIFNFLIPLYAPFCSEINPK